VTGATADLKHSSPITDPVGDHTPEPVIHLQMVGEPLVRSLSVSLIVEIAPFFGCWSGRR